MLRTCAVLLAGFVALGEAEAGVEAPHVADASKDANISRREPAAPDDRAPSASGNPLWAIPLQQLSATRDRPLFAPTRRPPPVVTSAVSSAPPPPPPSKPPEPEKPTLALIGTAIGGAAERVAVFFDNAARSVVRLKAGEDHQGWILRLVQRREVVLEKGREKAVLSLPPPEQSKNLPMPSPAPPENRSVKRPEKTSPPPSGTAENASAPPAVGPSDSPPIGVNPPSALIQPPQFKPAPPPVNPFKQQLIRAPLPVSDADGDRPRRH
jgi:hypothetical protein